MMNTTSKIMVVEIVKLFGFNKALGEVRTLGQIV